MIFANKVRIFASVLALSTGLSAGLPAAAVVGDSSTATKRIALKTDAPCIGWTRADDAEPKAVILCLHELGLHSGSFEDMGKKMAQRGFVSYAIDLRGFGQWAQNRSKESQMNLDNTFKDTVAALKAIQKAHPGVPIFVLGEAMGGAMALKVAQNHPELVAGAISSAPGGEHFKQGKLDMSVGSRLLTSANKKYPYGKDFISMGTAKPATRESFEKDSMVRLELTPRECMQCQFFMFSSKGMAKKIKNTPVMIVQGQLDKMAKPYGATNVYNRLSTKERKLYMVPDGDHYVYEDPNIPESVIATTVDWMSQYLGKRN